MNDRHKKSGDINFEPTITNLKLMNLQQISWNFKWNLENLYQLIYKYENRFHLIFFISLILEQIGNL